MSPHTSLLALSLLALASPLLAQDTCMVPVQRFVDDDPLNIEACGRSVDVEAGRVLVGVTNDVVGGFTTGSVRAYFHNGTAWVFESELLGTSQADFAGFGSSVSIDVPGGDRAAVGAAGEDEVADNAGAVYLFERSGGAWTRTARLEAGDPALDELFGARVVLQGDRLLASAPGDNNSVGAVYSFELVGTQWVQQQKFVPLDFAVQSEFGSDLDAHLDVAVVAAAGDDAAETNAGAAYVFSRNAGLWVQAARLQASDPQANAFFGRSLAYDGTTIAVGAGPTDAVTGNRGAVYVFEGSGTSWTQTARVEPPASIPTTGFGSSVAIRGDDLYVGDPFYDEPPVQNYGAVYWYRREAGVWTLRQRFREPFQTPQAQFGASLALDGIRLLVGAPFQSVDGPGLPGAAYLWELDAMAMYCTGKTNSLGCVPFLSTSGHSSATETSPFLIRADDALPGEVGVLLYGHGRANLSFHGGKLCVKAPFQR